MTMKTTSTTRKLNGGIDKSYRRLPSSSSENGNCCYSHRRCRCREARSPLFPRCQQRQHRLSKQWCQRIGFILPRHGSCCSLSSSGHGNGAGGVAFGRLPIIRIAGWTLASLVWLSHLSLLLLVQRTLLRALSMHVKGSGREYQHKARSTTLLGQRQWVANNWAEIGPMVVSCYDNDVKIVIAITKGRSTSSVCGPRSWTSKGVSAAKQSLTECMSLGGGGKGGC